MNQLHTSFGILKSSGICESPNNVFVWTGKFENTSDTYKGDVPIYIFTHQKQIPGKLLNFITFILAEKGDRIEQALKYLRVNLLENPQNFNIKDCEIPLLQQDIVQIPIDLPQFLFWEDTVDWAIHFQEGTFDICDPYGIIVHFEGENPISIENLENASPC